MPVGYQQQPAVRSYRAHRYRLPCHLQRLLLFTHVHSHGAIAASCRLTISKRHHTTGDNPCHLHLFLSILLVHFFTVLLLLKINQNNPRQALQQARSPVPRAAAEPRPPRRSCPVGATPAAVIQPASPQPLQQARGRVDYAAAPAAAPTINYQLLTNLAPSLAPFRSQSYSPAPPLRHTKKQKMKKK